MQPSLEFTARVENGKIEISCLDFRSKIHGFCLKSSILIDPINSTIRSNQYRKSEE